MSSGRPVQASAQRYRLYRRLSAQATYLSQIRGQGASQDLRTTKTAESTLTAAHAQAGKGLGAIDLLSTQAISSHVAHLACRDALTPADNGVIRKGRRNPFGYGEGARHTFGLKPAQTLDPSAQARQLVLARLRQFLVQNKSMSGKLTAGLSGIGTADPSPVTGDINARSAFGPTIGIDPGEPLAKAGIELEPTTSDVCKLGLGT
jgi:hypothetical protein